MLQNSFLGIKKLSDSGVIGLQVGGWRTGAPACKFIRLDSALLGLVFSLKPQRTIEISKHHAKKKKKRGFGGFLDSWKGCTSAGSASASMRARSADASWTGSASVPMHVMSPHCPSSKSICSGQSAAAPAESDYLLHCRNRELNSLQQNIEITMFFLCFCKKICFSWKTYEKYKENQKVDIFI